MQHFLHHTSILYTSLTFCYIDNSTQIDQNIKVFLIIKITCFIFIKHRQCYCFYYELSCSFIFIVNNNFIQKMIFSMVHFSFIYKYIIIYYVDRIYTVYGNESGKPKTRRKLMTDDTIGFK